MNSLLEKIRNSQDCIVLPPSGLPNIDRELSLPQDIVDFYQRCGGVKFFVSSDYTMEIVTPNEFVLSNPAILPEGWEEELPESDISNDWYIVAAAGSEQKISVDLNKSRIGRCYDSFWDIHASPGDSPVVATTFSELLERIFNNQGGYWFWLEQDFISLGDAYK